MTLVLLTLLLSTNVLSSSMPVLDITRKIPQNSPSCSNNVCSCYLRVTDCSSRELEDVPTEVNGTVTLLLRNNLISTLPRNAFINWGSYLEELDLSNNSLTTFQKRSFQGLSRLILLDVSHNRLRSSLVTEALNPLVNLQGFSARNNELTGFAINSETDPPTSFSNIYLRDVFLDNNLLENIDLKQFDQSKINRLTIKNNKISKLDFLPLSIEYLDIRNNFYTTFQRQVTENNRNIKVLLIGHSEFELEKNNFPSLTKLEVLHLDGYNQKQIPESFFNAIVTLKQFTELRIANSMVIEDISRGSNETNFSKLHLSNLTNLQSLKGNFASVREFYVRDCPFLRFDRLNLKYAMLTTFSLIQANFSTLNQSLTGLAEANRLTQFVLEKSGLTYFDSTSVFGINNNIQTMRNISLAENSIREISKSSFLSFPEISTINLRSNVIQQVDLAEFSTYTHLMSIDFSNNLITTVINSRTSVVYPDFINLSENRITQLQGLYFTELNDIIVFDISRNQLATFSSFFHLNSSSFRFIVEDNPWECTCMSVANYREVSNLLLRECINDDGMLYDCVICKTPETVAGYMPSEVTCQTAPPQTPQPPPLKQETTITIIVGSTAAVVVVIAISVIVFYIFCKGKTRKPLSRKLRKRNDTLPVPKHEKNNDIIMDNKIRPYTLSVANRYVDTPKLGSAASIQNDSNNKSTSNEMYEAPILTTFSKHSADETTASPTCNATDIGNAQRESLDNKTYEEPIPSKKQSTYLDLGRMDSRALTEAPIRDSFLSQQMQKTGRGLSTDSTIIAANIPKTPIKTIEQPQRESSNSFYEGGYMIMPAGQTLPREKKQQSVYEDGYIVCPYGQAIPEPHLQNCPTSPPPATPSKVKLSQNSNNSAESEKKNEKSQEDKLQEKSPETSQQQSSPPTPTPKPAHSAEQPLPQNLPYPQMKERPANLAESLLFMFSSDENMHADDVEETTKNDDVELV